MANELFCLKWNNYTSNIITELDSLRADGDLVDVTILCDGRKIAAHKVILSACSSYFRKIFRENPCQHPVVILKDINYEDIEAVLCFVYQGTVFISKSRMESFLKTAESLQIRGLAGASNMMGDNEENGDLQSEDISKVTKRSKPLPPLASVSSNVPATAPPVSKNSPSSKRRKLVPNINQIENVGEEVQNPMNTSKIQNEDSRSFSTSILNRQDKHTSEGGTDNETKDVDEDSNTYSNTSYSRTDEVEDDNQLQYRDDNEENEEEEEECNEPHLSQGAGSRGPPVGEWRCMQPQVCLMCSRKFSNAGNLRQHIANVHSPAQHVPCSICSRVFKNKEYLRKHYVQIHGAPSRKKHSKERSSGSSQEQLFNIT